MRVSYHERKGFISLKIIINSATSQRKIEEYAQRIVNKVLYDMESEGYYLVFLT